MNTYVIRNIAMSQPDVKVKGDHIDLQENGSVVKVIAGCRIVAIATAETNVIFEE